jgi:hypothetical protein
LGLISTKNKDGRTFYLTPELRACLEASARPQRCFGARGLFLQFWPDIASMVSRDLVHPVFGALLVLSMRFMPNGVAGMVSASRWLATWATRARL